MSMIMSFSPALPPRLHVACRSPNACLLLVRRRAMTMTSLVCRVQAMYPDVADKAVVDIKGL